MIKNYTEQEKRKGLLISFEGLDGSGKSTQVEMLGKWLTEHYLDHSITREPGGTRLGLAVRKLILEPPELLTPLAELYLFLADRAQHFANIVLPALDAGKIVVTDRCLDSNIVYQSMKGIDLQSICMLSLQATHGRIPDITILLDLPSEEVHKRRSGTGDISRFDRESIEYHERRREGFLDLARNDPDRIVVVDAMKPEKEVYNEIIDLLLKKFPLEMRGLEER